MTIASATPETATVKPRYRAPRKLLRWNADPHLKALKMLAAVVFDAEKVRSAAKLESIVRDMWPHVARAVLDCDLTYDEIVAETLHKQGVALTPAKLLQRADKTWRYGEFNEYYEHVFNQYLIRRTRSTAPVGPQPQLIFKPPAGGLRMT